MHSESTYATRFFARRSTRGRTGHKNQPRAASRSRPNWFVASSNTPRCAYTAANSSGRRSTQLTPRGSRKTRRKSKKPMGTSTICSQPIRSTVRASFSSTAETDSGSRGSRHPGALRRPARAVPDSTGRSASRSDSRCARTAQTAPRRSSRSAGGSARHGRPPASWRTISAAQPGGVYAMTFQCSAANAEGIPGRSGRVASCTPAAARSARTTEKARRSIRRESSAPPIAAARWSTPATAQTLSASAQSSAAAPGIPGSRPAARAMPRRIGQKNSQAGSKSCAAKLSAETSRAGTAKARKRRGSRKGVCPRGMKENQSRTNNAEVSQVANRASEPPCSATRSGRLRRCSPKRTSNSAVDPLNTPPIAMPSTEMASRPHWRCWKRRRRHSVARSQTSARACCAIMAGSSMRADRRALRRRAGRTLPTATGRHASPPEASLAPPGGLCG